MPTQLLVAILGPQSSLLADFHGLLGSEGLSIEAMPGLNGDLPASLTLTYRTAVGGTMFTPALTAHNTETLVVRQDATSFDIRSTCRTSGVPLSGYFVNNLAWRAELHGNSSTRLVITGDCIIPKELRVVQSLILLGCARLKDHF